jgi:hypothetical protein
MFRRWLIRGLALTLLTLCVMAWVGSYFWKIGVEHWGAIDFWELLVNRGHLELHVVRHLAPNSHIWWRWIHYDASSYWYEFGSGSNYDFLGFYLGYGPSPGTAGAMAVLIPLWFPIFLSALLLWLVWRKTRPKYNGKGFPIESTAKAK